MKARSSEGYTTLAAARGRCALLISVDEHSLQIELAHMRAKSDLTREYLRATA